jgi:hypothetical protein
MPVLLAMAIVGCTGTSVPDAGPPIAYDAGPPPVVDSGPPPVFDAGTLPTGPFDPTITLATGNETCPTCSTTDPTCMQACGGGQQYIYDFSITVANSGMAGYFQLLINSPDVSSMDNPLSAQQPTYMMAGQTQVIGPLEVVQCGRIADFSADLQIYMSAGNIMDVGTTPVTLTQDSQCNP